MNILVLTPWFPDHPSDQHGNFVLDSVESLCAAGHRVHVLVTRPFRPMVMSGAEKRGCGSIGLEMFKRSFTLSCSQYLSLPRNHLRFLSNRLYLWGCGRAVRQAVADHHVQLIHAHTESAGFLACSVQSGTQVPVITTLHGINLAKRYLDGFGQKSFMRRALSCPDRLVLVGQPLLGFVQRYVDGPAHVRIVHNGFRAAGAMPFRLRRVLSSKERVQIASVSNLVEGKGIDLNLLALARPEIARLPYWHYHIVGDGPQRPQLEAQARQLGIADRVTFHGACDHDKVYQVLSACDVFSLPSSPEAFGVAYVEAMACGLLAIGVATEGPSAFIEHGVSGMLIGAQHIDDLEVCLLDILSNPVHYSAMAETGRERVWRDFTWQAHAQALTRVFDEASQQRTSLGQIRVEGQV